MDAPTCYWSANVQQVDGGLRPQLDGDELLLTTNKQQCMAVGHSAAHDGEELRRVNPSVHPSIHVIRLTVAGKQGSPQEPRTLQ